MIEIVTKLLILPNFPINPIKVLLVSVKGKISKTVTSVTIQDC
jgi:hypothetical protein